MATVSGQGHFYGQIVTDGNSNVTLGNVYIGGDVSSGTAKQTVPIVSALTYHGMNSRYNQLVNRRATHLDWIWNTREARSCTSNGVAVLDSKVQRRGADFVGWLVRGGSMFWISGKPGSGRSSLIHYLPQQHRCSEILQQDSANQWHVIHFFFDYRLGKNKANSIEGMLRTLLAQLVKKSIQISKYVASTSFGQYLHADSDELACDTLRDTISRSIKATNSRVCMFIDGLDEFEGAREELVPYFKELADGVRVKLCVGYRPEPVFKQEFGTIPSINMQDFNHGAIADFAREHIFGSAKTLSYDTNLLSGLVERIAVDSSGVFL